ncbi:hypothetical protein MK543_04755 [Streptococcus gallolyticus subsp. gallolyticus]|nr:hypothetical protein [Streptococcus gallolyticus subsp. gallolyticus]MCY7180614.1 hypothetical protein [Streptococcus gallolyticus subsp. gallolyticus]
MHFGFSYVGFIFLMLLMIPNLIWTRNKPKDYEHYQYQENKYLSLLERIGEIVVTCLILIFSDFNWQPWTNWNWWLIAASFCLILYEMFWIRYFMGPKRMADFYTTFLKIPVAGASLPILAVLCISIYGKNPFLTLASIILGIGHIGIHLQYQNMIKKDNQ